MSTITTTSRVPPLTPPLCTANLDVSGRVFVVSGGTQGLGLAVCRQLRRLGAAGLILVSRSVDKGAAAVQELQDLTSATSDDADDDGDAASLPPCRVVHVPTDLSDASQTASVLERAAQLWNNNNNNDNNDKTAPPPPPPPPMHISGLVNAAAVTARGNLFTTTPTAWDEQFAINVRAPFLLTQAVAAHMMEWKNRMETTTTTTTSSPRPRCAIVNITSCAAHGGAPFVMAYSATKAAAVNLTKTTAAQLAPHGITVNAVNLGWCYTDNEDALQTAQTDAAWIARADASVPLGRILRPADAAVTVSFLLSDASQCMTASIVDLHPEFAHGMLSLQESDAR